MMMGEAGRFNEGIEAHTAALRDLSLRVGQLVEISAIIVSRIEAGGRLYLMGNGGSAADAQHIAAEFIGRFKKNRKPLPAVALTTDTSMLTAVSNDMSFEAVFERQIEALVRQGDVVWALSVSGTSPNIVRGLRAARARGAFTIGFTGNGTNEFDSLCDRCLRAAHRDSDRVQEIHQLAYHLICDAVESHFA